jgi:hypothetical protein
LPLYRAVTTCPLFRINFHDHVSGHLLIHS